MIAEVKANPAVAAYSNYVARIEAMAQKLEECIEYVKAQDNQDVLDFWNLAPREDYFFILGGLEILNFWNSAPREDCFFILVGGH